MQSFERAAPNVLSFILFILFIPSICFIVMLCNIISINHRKVWHITCYPLCITTFIRTGISLMNAWTGYVVTIDFIYLPAWWREAKYSYIFHSKKKNLRKVKIFTFVKLNRTLDGVQPQQSHIDWISAVKLYISTQWSNFSSPLLYVQSSLQLFFIFFFVVISIG